MNQNVIAQKGELFNYLDSESVEKLKKSLDVFQCYVTRLDENTIENQDLLLGLKHSENLINIAETLDKIQQFHLPFTPDALRILMECREKDMKMLKDELNIVEGLKSILKLVRPCKYAMLTVKYRLYFVVITFDEFKRKTCVNDFVDENLINIYCVSLERLGCGHY